MTATIEAQIELEQKMVERGAEQYNANNQKAIESGRAAELESSRRLMQDFLQPLALALQEEIKPHKGAGRFGRAKGLLRRVDPYKAMFITLRCLFNSFTSEESLQTTCTKIGKMVEDEVRFTRFQEMYGDYYDTIVKDFKRKGTKDYRYKQRVLTHSANENEDNWIAWTSGEKADVGSRLIDIVLVNTDLIEKQRYFNNGKTYYRLAPSENTESWIKEHDHVHQFLHPYREPCIIEPDPWTDLRQGGYYTPRMRNDTPMVKAANNRQKKLLQKADLSRVASAINIIQNTAWQVNTEVLEVVRAVWAMDLAIGMPHSKKKEISPCPIGKDRKKEELSEDELAVFTEWKREVAEAHTEEKDRVSKSFQTSRIIRMANQYSQYNKFWYVWYCDFRGRMYTATAGFSPQGPDLAKGLIRFGTGKALGTRGLYWLKVHIANRFGYDKASYDDRVKWVDDRHDELMACAGDPLTHKGVWGNADKPWQFLAALFEYKRAHEGVLVGRPIEEFVSHLAVGLDGSCNGLQNFSAMLRDAVGGRATNLTANAEPSDIYAEVAKVLLEKLRAMGTDPMAASWIKWAKRYGKDGNLPRDLAKRPVMTLPYGSTQQSCANYVYQHISKTDKKFFESNWMAARWLTPYLWQSIGEVVIAARQAMDWLKQCASVMSRRNLPLTWQTADGFIATQHIRKSTKVRVLTQLQGDFKMSLKEFTDEIAPIQQRNGIAPNFVHSQDALHLRTTVRLAKMRGIEDFACIHDDYGTHAADTDLLHKCIREAFVMLYDKCDPLLNFKKMQESYSGVEMPELPKHGDLDIKEVLRSEHFFG